MLEGLLVILLCTTIVLFILWHKTKIQLVESKEAAIQSRIDITRTVEELFQIVAQQVIVAGERMGLQVFHNMSDLDLPYIRRERRGKSIVIRIQREDRVVVLELSMWWNLEQCGYGTIDINFPLREESGGCTRILNDRPFHFFCLADGAKEIIEYLEVSTLNALV